MMSDFIYRFISYRIHYSFYRDIFYPRSSPFFIQLKINILCILTVNHRFYLTTYRWIVVCFMCAHESSYVYSHVCGRAPWAKWHVRVIR
jgi:hypothetical protein